MGLFALYYWWTTPMTDEHWRRTLNINITISCAMVIAPSMLQEMKDN